MINEHYLQLVSKVEEKLYIFDGNAYEQIQAFQTSAILSFFLANGREVTSVYFVHTKKGGLICDTNNYSIKKSFQFALNSKTAEKSNIQRSI